MKGRRAVTSCVMMTGPVKQMDESPKNPINNGDSFLFDVSAKGNDYPVYWYQNEENTLEPFAPNFAECIKRFAQRN